MNNKNQIYLYDTGLEKEALSVIAMDNNQYESMGLTALDFYDLVNKEIYLAMIKLRGNMDPINVATIYATVDNSQLGVQQIVEAIGVVDLINAQFVAKKLKEYRFMREAVNALKSQASPLKMLLEVAKKAETELNSEQIMNVGKDIIFYEDIIEERINQIKQNGSVGLITGFKQFENRFLPGDVVVLAARSSIGKSALALSLAVNVSGFGQNVLFFSAEMDKGSVLDRIAGQLTRIPVKQFSYPNNKNIFHLAKNEMETVCANLWLMDGDSLTSSKVVATTKRLVQNGLDVKLVVVDYLQYLSDAKDRGETDNNRVSKMMRTLKDLAKDVGCVVLVLSQVSREAAKGSDGMPELHHLRDSGSIEQDADTVIMLNRENKDDVVAQLRIAKARRDEADKWFELYFNVELQKYSDTPVSQNKRTIAQL